VLAAQREPWLLIDPKPLIGEREFALAPIVRSSELGGTRGDVVHRLDFLSAELGLDRERARWWTIGQTVAWSTDTSHYPEHLDVVRWLMEAAE
jgi:streptomycin 6-kinase